MTQLAKPQDVAKAIERMKKLAAACKQLETEAKAIHAKPLNVLLKGFVKVYMDAVKVSNGLTNAKPSCITALQLTEKAQPAPQLITNIQKATAALKAQTDEVLKKSGAGHKDAKAFADRIAKLSHQLEALIG